jgi:phosphate transport system permease protein
MSAPSASALSRFRYQLAARDSRRKVKNALFLSLLVFASILAITPLIAVFIYALKQGFAGLSLDFFTKLPAPVGESGGGMANALVGTAVLLALGSGLGVPLGIAVGVFLSEFGTGRLASFTRFSVDVLTSVPSIIVGLFAYALIVVPMKHFSAMAGGVALSIVMIPIVARSTEEILKLVPVHVREAGLALGIPRWKVILRILLPGSAGGITTGVMLAVARAAGETAPLLFTAFSNQFWGRGIDQPIASLPVQIYTYAISPFEEWHQQAWTGAFVLIVFVLSLNLLTRLILRKRT